MSDDFSLLNSVVSPFLERIGREERLSGDQPRKPKNFRSQPERKPSESAEPDTTPKTDDSIPSPHIDLRI